VKAAMSGIVVAAPRAGEHMLMQTSSDDRFPDVAPMYRSPDDGLLPPDHIGTIRTAPTA
jgi:hypothetical protein